MSPTGNMKVQSLLFKTLKRILGSNLCITLFLIDVGYVFGLKKIFFGTDIFTVSNYIDRSVSLISSVSLDDDRLFSLRELSATLLSYDMKRKIKGLCNKLRVIIYLLHISSKTVWLHGVNFCAGMLRMMKSSASGCVKSLDFDYIFSTTFYMRLRRILVFGLLRLTSEKAHKPPLYSPLVVYN